MPSAARLPLRSRHGEPLSIRRPGNILGDIQVFLGEQSAAIISVGVHDFDPRIDITDVVIVTIVSNLLSVRREAGEHVQPVSVGDAPRPAPSGRMT